MVRRSRENSGFGRMIEKGKKMRSLMDRSPVLVERDSLEPGLLPADPYWLEVSSDAPSTPGVRPFGLTRTSVVPQDKITVIAGICYDPIRQITVDDEGVPAIHLAARKQPSHSPETTQEDGQTWTDQNADD
jgi:putative ATP-grasp target RiPP